MNSEAVGVLVSLERQRTVIEKRIGTLKASLAASGENVAHIEATVMRRLSNDEEYTRHDRAQQRGRG